MRRKIISLLLCIMLVISVIAGCSGNSDSNEKMPATTENSNNNKEDETEKTENNEHEGTHSGVKDDVTVITNGDVYDGINRIAITFHGNSETQIGLSWYTPNTDDKFYGNDVEVIDAATMEKVAIKYEVDVGEAEYDSDSMYHQTVVTGLKQGKEYYFRVGDEAAKQWSEYGSFKTSSPDMEEFRFVAVTDTQSAHLPDAYFSAATIRKAIEIAENSAFIIHGGDFVEDGDEEYLWLAQMNTAQDILLNNIIAPAVGNHEEDDNAYWQHFKIPHTNDHKTTGAYYSYDYGNVHFVVLDTNKENEEETSYIDDEQLQWLKSDLKAANDNGADWIIVNIHKGLYTVGEHSDNEKFAGEDGARERVGQVFEDYGVDLVIQGHDHCPSATKPLKDGKVSKDGIVYINTGSAGAKTYELDKSIMPDEYYELFDYMDEEERDDDTFQNFAIVDVSEEKLCIKMYEMNMLINENNLYIIKELEITK